VAFVKYSLIRLALFLPLFALFVFLQLGWLLSVVCAGLISFAISYLFFQKQRDAATASLHARFSGRAKPIRTANEVDDANAEDRLVDANPDIKVRTDAGTEARGKDA
jgi:mannitol-specific phosphotransferase system IIBC component